MRRLLAVTAVLSIMLVACGSADQDTSNAPDLTTISAGDFEARLETLDSPAVVNVWASWCIPCRSEAPLLNAAFEAHGDDIAFIGVDVQDNQSDAKDFLAEFGLEFTHYFDQRRAIPNHYAVIGTPVTLFFAAGGELIIAHQGVIDERTLALGIDELRRR